MSQLRTTVYQYFQTDDIPTEKQFQFAWSSVWFKDENFTISHISGLETVLVEKLDREHLNDENAHDKFLVKLDASNLNNEQKEAWKNVLEVGEIPQNVALVDNGESTEVFNKVQVLELVSNNSDSNLVSEDSSIFFERETQNIESNVSFFTEEFTDLDFNSVGVSFPAIQILGVYDGGIRLNKDEYQLKTNQIIELTTARKATLVDGLTTVVTVDYTHLKTDIL